MLSGVPMPTFARDTGLSSTWRLASTPYAPRTSRHTGSRRRGSSQASAQARLSTDSLPSRCRAGTGLRTSLEACATDADVGVCAIDARSPVLARERGTVIVVDRTVISAEAAVALARIFRDAERVLTRPVNAWGRPSGRRRAVDVSTGAGPCNIVHAHLHSSWSSWHRYPRQPAAQRHCSDSSVRGASSSNRVPNFPRHTPPFSHLHVPAGPQAPREEAHGERAQATGRSLHAMLCVPISS